MDFIFELILVALLLSLGKRQKGFRILVWLQFISFLLHYLTGLYVVVDSIKTIFNIVFVCISLYLILAPWSYVNFKKITIKNRDYYFFYRKILYFFLRINIFLNIFVLVVIYTYFPDIADFKHQEFTNLYDQIPYFGFVFRYCASTQTLGILALPICAYYISRNNKREAIKAFVLSTSTFISALAFFSRAQMLTYALTCVCIFYLLKSSFRISFSNKFEKYLKFGSLVILLFFLAISYTRFNSEKMVYLKDRIRQESIVKSYTTYYLIDYASMGYVFGIEQLDRHTIDDILWGGRTFRFLKLQLGFFHIINYDSKAAAEEETKAYEKNGVTEGNTSSAFHGYTCDMVKDFGYFITILIGLYYYYYVRRASMRHVVEFDKLNILSQLLIVPCLSIFYNGFGSIIFSLLFIIFVKTIYRLRTA